MSDYKTEEDAITLQRENEALKDLNRRLEWRWNHARSQYITFMEQVIPLIDQERLSAIFQELGRNCARSLGWAQRYVGDPEGFFEHMERHSGEQIAFSDDKKVITVVTQNRPCDCPIMKGRCIAGAYCDCSIGWQTETYETILGKNVRVNIKEAVFRGSNRCVFEVHIEE
jgi:predicted hydrocarbon binding protein